MNLKTLCSFTTPADTAAGVLDVGTIVLSNLVTGIDALDNYEAEPIGNTIVVTRTDGRDFNLRPVVVRQTMLYMQSKMQSMISLASSTV